MWPLATSTLAACCRWLQLGDVVDVRDEEMGAWFEARIVSILPVVGSNSNSAHSGTSAAAAAVVIDDAPDDTFLYSVVFERSVLLSWRRGGVVSSVRRMNQVNPRRARLVLGWVTIFWRVFHLGM